MHLVRAARATAVRGAGESRASYGRQAGSVPTVVKELGLSPRLPLRQARCPGAVLRVDVRELAENERFHGFTRKGVCLSLEEFQVLLEQRGPARDRTRRADAKAEG